MKSGAKILIVDDELGIRDLLSSELAARNYEVAVAANGEEAIEKVRREKFQLVISDVKMPKMGGLEMLDAVKKLDPDIEVIMSTGYGTIETAVSAMKRGAYDFVQKPFNLDEILSLVDKALEKHELKALLGVYETSKAVFASVKLDDLLPVMASLGARILNAGDAEIFLKESSGALTLAAEVGLGGDERLVASRLALGEGAIGRPAHEKAAVIINGPGSSLVFPLTLNGELLGVLVANRSAPDHPFAAAEIRQATIFGSQIAQAIQNAKLYGELERKIAQVQTMQQQLIQSEKLAAVGQLAAGVAHEINNPLTGIMGFAELLAESEDLSSEQREDMQSILHQSRRCRTIVQSLLQFSRRRKRENEPVDVPAVLETVFQLARHEFQRAKVKIIQDRPASVPRIMGDASQLEQVFLNLATNARQAMEGRPGSVLAIRLRTEADRLVLSFEDNGPGIPPENLSKIFDPFFTTKSVGQGTGLGLSISYGIIQDHQGAIKVDSQVGRGTTFFIDLPIAENAAS